MEKTLKDALRAVSEPPEAAPTVGFVLEVVAGPDQRKRLTVSSARVLIGTSPICDLVLTDERVSRRHLALSVEDTTLRVEDLQSTNGTFANEIRIAGAYLRGGETITIGKTLLLVTLVAAEAGEKLVHSVSFGGVLGTSTKMQRVYAFAKKIAASDISCTIEGETGTGKEQLAEAIHDASPRTKGPFIVFDCTALPGTLMESALFGHEKGSFTGAVKREPGKIEVAEGGTVFLDEIGDMPLPLQSRLLRVLQDQTFFRVGGTQSVRTDVRFIAATNKDIRRAIQQGAFREDLYYRLAVIAVTLPPLRERADDIPALAKHFLTRALRMGIHGPCALSDRALRALQQYRWPGNVRELENVLTRALILCPEDTLEPTNLHLADSLSPSSTEAEAGSPTRDYHAHMDAYSRKILEETLRRHGWNQTKAAEELGLQRTYLTKLLKQKDVSGKPPHENSDES